MPLEHQVEPWLARPRRGFVHADGSALADVRAADIESARAVAGVVESASERHLGSEVVRTSRVRFAAGAFTATWAHDAYDLARTDDDQERWTREVFLCPGATLTVLVDGRNATPLGTLDVYVMLDLEELVELAAREDNKDLLYRACDLAPTRADVAELARRVRLDEDPVAALRARCAPGRLAIFAAR